MIIVSDGGRLKKRRNLESTGNQGDQGREGKLENRLNYRIARSYQHFIREQACNGRGQKFSHRNDYCGRARIFISLSACLTMFFGTGQWEGDMHLC